MARLSTADLGLLGERLLARRLQRSGYALLGQRVLTPAGELDLVFQREGRLVCVEVKTRRGLSGPLRPAPDQPRRVRAAARWLARRAGVVRPPEVRWVLVRIDTRRGRWDAVRLDPESRAGPQPVGGASP